MYENSQDIAPKPQRNCMLMNSASGLVLCLYLAFTLTVCQTLCQDPLEAIQRKTWRMGPYAWVDYNLTLCPLQSRLQHIYHGRATLCQSRLYPPGRDFRFSLWIPILASSRRGWHHYNMKRTGHIDKVNQHRHQYMALFVCQLMGSWRVRVGRGGSGAEV